MKLNELSTNGINWVVIVLGLLSVGLIFAVFTGKKLPILNTDRTALIGLVVIGMAICAQAGIGPMSHTGAWSHPLSIIAYLLGALIIIIGAVALFQKNIPPLTDFHQSFIVVVVIAGIKIILTTIHRLFF